MRKIIDVVIRSKDEKGRIRFWHKQHIDLDKLVFKVDEDYNRLDEYK